MDLQRNLLGNTSLLNLPAPSLCPSHLQTLRNSGHPAPVWAQPHWSLRQKKTIHPYIHWSKYPPTFQTKWERLIKTLQSNNMTIYKVLCCPICVPSSSLINPRGRRGTAQINSFGCIIIQGHKTNRTFFIYNFDILFMIIFFINFDF